MDIPRPPTGDQLRVSSGVQRADAAGAWTLALLISSASAAFATLTPEGTGWAWGSPVAELHWYLTGVGSPATMLQLIGNLALLAVPAALVVGRWPAWGRAGLLTAAFLPIGTCIELLQWALPLGRVVSPLDAVLNTTGAVAGGLVAARLSRHSACAPSATTGGVADEPAAGRRRHGVAGNRVDA